MRTWGFFIRGFLKAVVLFIILNLIFAVLQPLPALGKISLYNSVFPGRERLPYGANAAASYNLSLNSLEAMFASHEISRDKASDEFRVILIGDSSTWGFLLELKDTLAGQINAGDYRAADGRKIVVYNLGYPTMSLTKDLLLLDYAMQYDPDAIVWLVTLESFPTHLQLDSPPVQHNPSKVRELIEKYDLPIDPDDSEFVEVGFLGQTIVGQRRALHDLLRLQIYGIAWAATRIDQDYPESYPLRQSDFEEDVHWKTLNGSQPIPESYLAFEVLQAGHEIAGDIPLLLVNEPMFISSGKNSDLRYNFFYPRWVYDDYREQLAQLADSQDWRYLDLWDIIPPEEFTDSPVHMTPEGTQQLSQVIGEALMKLD